eukprot:EG_transcript_20134
MAVKTPFFKKISAFCAQNLQSSLASQGHLPLNPSRGGWPPGCELPTRFELIFPETMSSFCHFLAANNLHNFGIIILEPGRTEVAFPQRGRSFALVLNSIFNCMSDMSDGSA